MFGYNMTVVIVNALVAFTLAFFAFVLWVWIRRKAFPQLVWATCLSATVSLVYCIVSLALEYFASQGSATCESLSSIVTKPASVLLGWMAYKGTGWIDKPLTTDQMQVLKCGAAFCFWVPFAAIMLLIMIKRTMGSHQSRLIGNRGRRSKP